MVRQLYMLLFGNMAICAIRCGAGQTLQVVVVVVDFRLVVFFVVVVCIPASAGSSGQIATAVLSVEGALIGVNGGEVITGVDGRSRIGDEVVAQVGKGAFHGRGNDLGRGSWDGRVGAHSVTRGGLWFQLVLCGKPGAKFNLR